LTTRVAALVLLLGFLFSTPVAAAADCTQSLQSLADAGGAVLVPACVYHETVYVSKPVVLDGQNAAVVDGDNTRDRWFWVASSDVTIQNFTMRNTRQGVQVGSIGTEVGISRLVIDHNDLSNASGGSLIGIGQTTDSVVRNNQLHGGGQLGIGSYLNRNLVVQGNHIYGNNTAGVDAFWEAGGAKLISDAGLQVLNNEVHDNAGPGLWIDIGATDVVVSGNVIHHQTWNPLFFEISSRGQIYGNAISSSNTNLDGGNWGCITVASSTDVNVHDNTCTDTLPLRAQLDNRPDAPAGAGTGNVLQNNRLLRPVPNQATSWWQWDPNGPLVPGRNGNVDVGNQIVSSLTTLTPVPTIAPTPTPKARPRHCASWRCR
jgi:nitrous oxidase accessory protein NosD